jgi:hypothetical protein
VFETGLAGANSVEPVQYCTARWCKLDEKGYAVARQMHTHGNSEFWQTYLVKNNVHQGSLLTNLSTWTTDIWPEML